MIGISRSQCPYISHFWKATRDCELWQMRFLDSWLCRSSVVLGLCKGLCSQVRSSYVPERWAALLDLHTAATTSKQTAVSHNSGIKCPECLGSEGYHVMGCIQIIP